MATSTRCTGVEKVKVISSPSEGAQSELAIQ